MRFLERLPACLAVALLGAALAPRVSAAAGGCDPPSYQAAYQACDEEKPECSELYSAITTACQNEVEQGIQAVDKAQGPDKAKAVEDLRELQRRIYYDMGDFKEYWFITTTGNDIASGGSSFVDFAKQSWERMNNVIEKAGFEKTPSGKPEPRAGDGDGEEEGGEEGGEGGSEGGHPDSKEAAEQLMAGGKPAEAERMLDKMLEADPKNPDLLAMRSVARLNQNEKSGALADADAALEADPKNKTAQEVKDFIELTGRAAGTDLKLKGPQWESKNMGARFEGAGGAGWDGTGGQGSGFGSRAQRPSQARGGYDAVDAGGSGWAATGRGPGAGAFAPSAQGTLPLSQGLSASQVHLREADKKLRLGDLSGAFLEATRAVKADARNAGAWLSRAAVSNRLKNHDAAISDATEALKLEPKNVPALLERGYAQYNLGNLSAALEDIGSAIKIEPMNALAYLYRGMVFEKMMRYTEALADYETAAKLDPTLRQFWEDAKARLLGRKAKAAKASGRSGRGCLIRWSVWGGLALLFLFSAIRMARKRLREQADAAREGADDEAGPTPSEPTGGP
jgi:tetratricopeptide (TPR) repeat protein